MKKTKTKIIGELLADIMAEFGGSWKFLLLFGSFMLGWMIFNTAVLFQALQFDPYPYILLNLVLSCIAAVQAPIIMMSANRQAERDRSLQKKDVEIGKEVVQELKQVGKQIEELNELIKTRRSEFHGKDMEDSEESDLEE